MECSTFLPDLLDKLVEVTDLGQDAPSFVELLFVFPHFLLAFREKFLDPRPGRADAMWTIGIQLGRDFNSEGLTIA